MNNLNNQYINAQNNFMMYSMKLTYGNLKDRIYNYKNADYWNTIMKSLKQQIIYEQSR